MPTVQILDEKKYTKAIGLLHKMGGVFRTRPIQQLIVGPAQLRALQDAGLVPKPGARRPRGTKNARVGSPSQAP